MDKLGQVQQKKGKAKKGKPIKVVYISNPMRVTTCPSQFRALVQELTGQDADPPLETANLSPPDSCSYRDASACTDVESDVQVATPIAPLAKQDHGQLRPSTSAQAAAPSDQEEGRSISTNNGATFEQLLEEVFDPRSTMEGFGGFNFPSPDPFLYDHPDG